MPAPEIALIKEWCRVDGDAQDASLQLMINSATVEASHKTGVNFAEEEMPFPVQQWVAANVAYWLDNPAAASEKKLDPSPFLDGLLDPYRTYRCIPAV